MQIIPSDSSSRLPQSDDAPPALHRPHTLFLLLLSQGPDPDSRSGVLYDALVMLAQVLGTFGVGPLA
jgi:hypothetical protein